MCFAFVSSACAAAVRTVLVWDAISRATLSCSERTSPSGPSKLCAQRCLSLRVSISWAVMRTRSPDRTTDPSTMASTLSSRAICASGLRVPLSCITDVRETTRRFGIFASSVISSSVIPSAKYSSLVPGDRSSSGKTANERIGGAIWLAAMPDPQADDGDQDQAGNQEKPPKLRIPDCW